MSTLLSFTLWFIPLCFLDDLFVRPSIKFSCKNIRILDGVGFSLPPPPPLPPSFPLRSLSEYWQWFAACHISDYIGMCKNNGGWRERKGMGNKDWDRGQSPSQSQRDRDREREKERGGGEKKEQSVRQECRHTKKGWKERKEERVDTNRHIDGQMDR